MEAAYWNPDIPIALHLDHGPDFATCKSCIDGGFTSVMIDASSKPFEENIKITKKWWTMPTITALWSKQSWVRWLALKMS